MTSALPLIEETENATKRRGVGSIQVTSGQSRIKLPLSGVKLRARVVDRLAHVTVTETFQNPFKDHLEAVYIFPLSGGCAVSSFQMKVGDRLIEGVVAERQAARQQYVQALQEGKRAALLEQDRDDVFTVQVGNLPPGEEVTVILTYSEKLPYFDRGLTEIRLPLVVAPRYIPGTPLDRDSVGDGVELDTDQVPDASRITPPRLAQGVNPNIDLDISVQIDAVEAVEDLSCSQHATRMGASKEGLIVSLAREDDLLDRDFVLRWRVAGDTVQSKFLVYSSTAGGASSDKSSKDSRKDSGKDSGKKPVSNGDYFGMISLMPPKADEIVRPARDVIFVVDRSGSMQGIKMVSAARACSFLLATLGPADRFAIQAFDNVCQWMPGDGGGNFIDADEAGIEAGCKFLRNISANGGTELHGALREAIQVMDKGRSKSRRMPVIVVLTDGEVGNESSIIQFVQRSLGDGRVFTVGIDTAVNDGFLRKLALIGGGTSTFVEPGAALERALCHVGREIGAPLITDLTIEDINCSLDEDSIAPESLPDLFEGRAVNAFFKLSPKVKDLSTLKLRLKGKYADGKKFSADVSATTTDVQSLPQLWARTTVVDLEDKYRLAAGTAQEKLRKQIIDIAVCHSLLTRFTAFVVVDHAEIVNKDGALRKVVQPVQTPAAWEEEQQLQTGSWGAPAQAQAWGAAPGAAIGGSWGAAPAPYIPPAPAGSPQPPMLGAGGPPVIRQRIQSDKIEGIGRSIQHKAFSDAESQNDAAANSDGYGSSDAWKVFEGGSGNNPWDVPPPASQPQQMNAPQPPQAPPPAPIPMPPKAKGLFKKMSEEAINKVFKDNLGVSDRMGAPMEKIGKSTPTPPPPPPPAHPAPPSPAVANGRDAQIITGAHQAVPGGGGGGGGADAVHLAFNKFEAALRQVLASLAAGKLCSVDDLDLARGELLLALAQSSVADRYPLLQKYLRADVLHLLSALASVSAVSQKLKDVAQQHEEIIAEITEEVEHSGQPDKPFWGMTV